MVVVFCSFAIVSMTAGKLYLGRWGKTTANTAQNFEPAAKGQCSGKLEIWKGERAGQCWL